MSSGAIDLLEPAAGAPRVSEEIRAGGGWFESSPDGLCVAAEMRPLQPFLWAARDDVAPLYTKQAVARDAAAGGPGRPMSGTVSFNSYFNSFYEVYWVTYTVVREVALVVAGDGRCWCTIRREYSDGSSSPVRTGVLDLDDGTPRSIDVALNLAPNAGRLIAEFGAIDQPFVLREITWSTGCTPEREVKVGLALCTFNREAFLTDTLSRLQSAPAAANIARIIVVNQGEPLVEPVGRDMQADGRLKFIHQDNFGGAGGFTRGAMELLEEPSISHILFMDDDIKVEPVHIVTAAAFSAFAIDELIVGGQMLDLFKPWMMFEAGTRVTPHNLLSANHRDLDLERHSALQALAHLTTCDFNAWWFSLIPANAFRRHGLPVPIFIRGDDQEFGVRLAEAGMPTVSLPPVSVWHEPFYAKPPGWQLYYDLRNRLIFASLYPDRFQLDGPLHLMKRLLAMMIRYDYQQARSIILALQDFGCGPALIAEPAPAIHRRVLETLGRHPHSSVSAADGLPLGDEEHPLDRRGGRRRLVSSFIRTLVSLPHANAAGSDCRLYAKMPLDLMRLGRAYVLSDDGDHFALRFSYSLSKTWIGLVRTMLAIARYTLVRRRVAAAWKQAVPELTSFHSWEARLRPQAVG